MLGRTVSAMVAAALVLASPRAQGAGFTEDFSSDPLNSGWKIVGDASLFAWSPGDEAMDVTWDSRRANSYFCREIGAVLTKGTDFSLGFSLRLSEVAAGVNPGKPYAFQFAVGFMNLSDAAGPGFVRGSGYESPNLFEFNYFPDTGFGATVSPVFISRENEFAAGFNHPFEMAPGEMFEVEMIYTAATRTLRTRMTRNGGDFGPIEDVVIGDAFGDFGVDHVSVSSYSDEGQHPDWGGSIRARGLIYGISVGVPEPPPQVTGRFSEGRWIVEVPGRLGWVYQLERSRDLVGWTSVGIAHAGDGSPVSLEDSETWEGAFYRVRIERP